MALQHGPRMTGGLQGTIAALQAATSYNEMVQRAKMQREAHSFQMSQQMIGQLMTNYRQQQEQAANLNQHREMWDRMDSRQQKEVQARTDTWANNLGWKDYKSFLRQAPEDVQFRQTQIQRDAQAKQQAQLYAQAREIETQRWDTASNRAVDPETPVPYRTKLHKLSNDYATLWGLYADGSITPDDFKLKKNEYNRQLNVIEQAMGPPKAKSSADKIREKMIPGEVLGKEFAGTIWSPFKMYQVVPEEATTSAPADLDYSNVYKGMTDDKLNTSYLKLAVAEHESRHSAWEARRQAAAENDEDIPPYDVEPVSAIHKRLIAQHLGVRPGDRSAGIKAIIQMLQTGNENRGDMDTRLADLGFTPDQVNAIIGDAYGVMYPDASPIAMNQAVETATSPSWKKPPPPILVKKQEQEQRRGFLGRMLRSSMPMGPGMSPPTPAWQRSKSAQAPADTMTPEQAEAEAKAILDKGADNLTSQEKARLARLRQIATGR